jgi:hypothetical protein
LPQRRLDVELLFPMELGTSQEKGNDYMQAAIERIMQTYGMIKTLSQAEETEIRGKVSAFLAGQRHIGGDEQKLTISGLRFLHNLGV